jgi:outer membrane protein assembly factor BamA
MSRAAKILLALVMLMGVQSASARDSDIDSADRFDSGHESPFVVREIRITGDTSFTIALGRMISKSLIDKILGGVIKLLQQQGYYYCSAEVSSVSVEADSLDISATMTFGPQVMIQIIQCEGLAKTSSATVQRYVASYHGQLLTPDRLHEIKSRARQIPFLIFDSASITPLPGYSSASVTLHFREPASVALQGNVGYRADDKNGLLWSFDGTVRNVIGDGRELRLNSERRDRRRNLLVIDYRQPAFWLGRGEFETQVQSRDYRDQFSEFSILAGVSSYAGDGDKIGGRIGWSRTDFANSTPEYSKYSAGVLYGASSLRDSVNPLSGYELTWSVDYQYRAYQNSGDSASVVRPSANESRARLRGGYFIAPFGPHAVSLVGLDLMAIFSDEDNLPTSELYLLGGPGSMRGYRTDQFAVRRAAVGTAELRLRGKSGYTFAFGDFGYLHQQLSDGTGDEMVKVGYGIGVRLIDQSKLVEVGLGWNPDIRLNRPQVMLRIATGL